MRKFLLLTTLLVANLINAQDFFKYNFDIYKGLELELKGYPSSADRNKGLPIIKQRLKENKIKNLKVITNNTFNEYSNKKDTFRYLNNKYDGTFFYFELDLTCYE